MPAKLIARSIVALTLAVAPMAAAPLGLIDSAYAKGGNGGGGGGGNGGGNGGGGGSSGSSSSHGSSSSRSSSSHGKSDNSRASKGTKGERSTEKSHHKSESSGSKSKAAKSVRVEKAAKSVAIVSDPVVEPVTPGVTPGFRSLNRNYHAYLNSNDPKMAAISAYAVAYAHFEAENGVDAIPADPALSDEALREALASFTRDGVVSDDMVDEAKGILGVGPANGKIDEIRETLPPPTVVVVEPEPEIAQ